MELKERLYKTLAEHPMSIAELARQTGVGYQRLCLLFTQDAKISFKNIMKLEKWLKDKETKE